MKVPSAGNEIPVTFLVLTDSSATTLEITKPVVASGSIPVVDLITSDCSMNPRTDLPSDSLKH